MLKAFYWILDNLLTVPRSFTILQLLPIELKKYTEKRKLEETLEKTTRNATVLQSKLEKKIDAVNSDSIQLAKKEASLEEAQSKVIFIKEKIVELKQKFEDEKARSDKLKDAAPPAITDDTDNVKENLKRCSVFLNKHNADELNDHNKSSSSIRDESESAWTCLNLQLADLSRCNIWKEILNTQTDALSNLIERIKKIQTTSPEQKHSIGVTTSKVNADNLKTVMLINHKQNLVAGAKNECDDTLTQVVQTLENNLDVDCSVDLITHYVALLAKMLCRKAKLTMLSEMLKSLKLKESRSFEKHEQLKKIYTDTQSLYSDVDTLSHKLDDQVEMLANTKISIEEAVVTMEEFIKSNFRAEKIGLNASNLSNLTLMSSTIGTTPGYALTEYVREFEIFDKVLIRNITASILTQKQINWQANPFILDDVPNIPFHSLNLQGLEERFQRMSRWNHNLDVALVEVRQVRSTFDVDMAIFNSMQNYSREKIVEYLDQMDTQNSSSRHNLEEATKKFRFMEGNVFERYVPRSKLFEGRTYFEYRNEYETLMNMRSKKK